MALAEICVCAQTVILVRPSWHFCMWFGRRSTHWQFFDETTAVRAYTPDTQWQAESFHGACGGHSTPLEAVRYPNASGRFDQLNGASTLRYGDASRQQLQGTQRLQKTRYGNHSRQRLNSTSMESRAAVKKEKRKIYYERCVLCLHRHLTSARSPHSPTTFSRYLLFSARSPLSLLYHLQRPQRWRGRQLSNIAS